MGILTIEQYSPAEYKEPLEMILRDDPHCLEAFQGDSESQAGHIHVALMDGNVAGYVSFSGFQQSVFTMIYVARSHRRMGVGTALISMADSIIQQNKQTERSLGSCLAGDRETLQFLYKNGYYASFSSYLMERNGPYLPHVDIEVRPYEDSDYPVWHRISSTAFYNMRNRAGILPSYYSPPDEQERESLLSNREDRFVLLSNGEVVATGSIDGKELDSVAVRDDLQRKGHGKAFVSYLINTIMQRGEKTVCLWVVDGNPARHLYEALGFRDVGKYCFVSRYYRPDSRLSSPPVL